MQTYKVYRKSKKRESNISKACFFVSYASKVSWPLFLSLAVKCGYPLAEVEMKQKTFFSHISGNLGASVRDLCGGLGHMVQIALNT